MPRRWTKAATGFVAGSLIDDLFLAGADAVHPSGPFRFLDSIPFFQSASCTRGSSFWVRVVAETGLSPLVQPHAPYLSGLTGALLYCRVNPALREDLPLSPHRIAGLAGTLLAAIALDL